MGRYNKFSTKNSTGYNMIDLPEFKYSNLYTTINVKAGERLDTLAKRFYNDSTLWWIIALYNELPGSSVFLQTSQLIKIPNNINNFI